MLKRELAALRATHPAFAHELEPLLAAYQLEELRRRLELALHAATPSAG